MTVARRFRAPLAPLIVIAGLIACGPATSTPSATPVQATPIPSATPTTTASSTPASTPDPNAVAVDPALLERLPASVDGVPLAADPVSAAQIATDPSLGISASAIAVALVVIASATEEDLAIASVVRLRPGVYSETFFVEWRASYDESACEPSGGAEGEVERVIGSFDAFVGSCVGGATTYHVHLPDDILISITSVGARELGALVVAGLR